MRAFSQHRSVAAGDVAAPPSYRHQSGRPQRAVPSPTPTPYTPSPSSSSAASGSSCSSSTSRSLGSAPRSASRASGAAALPTLASLDDDGDLWASIRLASSPPASSAPAARWSTQNGRPSGRVASGATVEDDDATNMLPLVIDDFSQERMGRIPTVKPNPAPAKPAKVVSSSSWSLRRAKSAPIPPPPTAASVRATTPLARALSAVNADGDITLMDHRVFVSRDQWVEHRARRACVVCDRDFGLLRKKHSCRMCGDVVCSRCSLFKQVKLPGVVGESKARVCSRCFLQYRHRVVQNTLSLDDAALDPAQDPMESDQNGEATDEDDDCAYESGEELPSVEDLLRRTTAEVNGVAAAAPVDFGGLHLHRNHKPVSLLAPELMQSMYRESSTRAAAAPVNSTNPNHIYGRGPSMVLLSPNSTYDLLDVHLFDLEQTQSFSSTISTVSSSLSSSSTASISSTRSATDEELAAAIRARELEKEVEDSRKRIQELESCMQEQENKKAELSLEQQKQLREARELIAQLQQQLKQQEQNARDAVITRDSILLSNMRQQQPQPLVPAGSDDSMLPGGRRQRSNSVEVESEALRQKLRLLERQLQQAGINVAEVIPYAIAKQRIMEISRRMAEISEAESTMKQDNPKGVVALRREYYVLEQEMERFHTALLMSDEYIEEQAAKEREWESTHTSANIEALRCVRSALPVDISRLSEQALRTMMTPSGKIMSADLARRFKRTNVLQLLRVPPETIMRMHPSVIENYRTAGLTLVERRALHEALRRVAAEWHKQSRDENAQRKAGWFKKLKDAFVQALLGYEQHVAKHHVGDADQCPFIGKMCPVRAEQAVAQLYNAQLGFPEGEEFFQQEIIKSDPEGAGEKALHEAKSQAQRAVALSERQCELKNHYGVRNIRLLTMALAAVEEIDTAMERLHGLDSKAEALAVELSEGEEQQNRWWRACEEIVNDVRELTFNLARRTGICFTGKRDRRKDSPDTRSKLEAKASYTVVLYMDSLLEDVTRSMALTPASASSSQLKTSLLRIRELVIDVQAKNESILFQEEPLLRALTPVVEADAEDEASEQDDDESSGASRSACSSIRVPWKERTLKNKDLSTAHPTNVGAAADESPTVSPRSTTTTPLIPRGSMLLDAIRAKRSVDSESADDSSNVAVVSPAPSRLELPANVVKSAKANDLLAAIRAKRSAMTPSASESADVVVPPPCTDSSSACPPLAEIAVTAPEKLEASRDETDEAPKANDLLTAIRARRAKTNAVSSVSPVDRITSSA